MKKNKGFTLIELMITVAIVGILSAVALPSYSAYTVRAQVTEGLILIESGKGNVVEALGQIGSLTGIDSVTAGFPTVTGKYVTNVDITNGIISATFGNDANASIVGGSVLLTPTQVGSGLVWACSAVGIDAKYLPNSCK